MTLPSTAATVIGDPGGTSAALSAGVTTIRTGLGGGSCLVLVDLDPTSSAELSPLVQDVTPITATASSAPTTKPRLMPYHLRPPSACRTQCAGWPIAPGHGQPNPVSGRQEARA